MDFDWLGDCADCDYFRILDSGDIDCSVGVENTNGMKGCPKKGIPPKESEE